MSDAYEWELTKYSPDQPRVPAGSSEGGRWTSGPGGALSYQPRKEPRLKQPLKRGTSGQVQDRERERAAEMERLNPGVKFSAQEKNPLGVAEGKRLGIPGSGLPDAIYPRRNDLPPVIAPSDSRTALVLKGAREWSFRAEPNWTGYVSFTTLSYGTGLSFEEVFSITRGLHEADPYSVRFSVNRGGDAVFVRFRTR